MIAASISIMVGKEFVKTGTGGREMSWVFFEVINGVLEVG